MELPRLISMEEERMHNLLSTTLFHATSDCGHLVRKRAVGEKIWIATETNNGQRLIGASLLTWGAFP